MHAIFIYIFNRACNSHVNKYQFNNMIWRNLEDNNYLWPSLEGSPISPSYLRRALQLESKAQGPTLKARAWSKALLVDLNQQLTTPNVFLFTRPLGHTQIKSIYRAIRILSTKNQSGLRLGLQSVFYFPRSGNFSQIIFLVCFCFFS